MHHRSLVPASLAVAVTQSLAVSLFAADPIEWPELPYEPCFRVERVLSQSEFCSQPGGGAHGRAINAHGTIVGEANCGAGSSRAFVWRMNAPFQWIPTPPGTVSSWAWAINDDGWVAGRLSGGSASGNGFAWHEQTGEFYLIPSPFESGGVVPRGINSDGVIVGTIQINQPGVTPVQGFLWHAGKMALFEEIYDFGGRMQFPTAIDDAGNITGYIPSGGEAYMGARPFLIQDGTLYEFDPFPKGWEGTVPGALLNDGIFMTESWHNPDMPSARVAAYGNATGYLDTVGSTQETYLRVTTNAGNTAGDSVGGGLRHDGSWEMIIIRHGVLHIMRDLMIGPYTDDGTARGISSNGQIASGRNHLVPASPPLGDLNGNCRRDLNDLPILLSQWGEGGGPADLNGDGRVDLADLLILLRLIADDLSL